MSTIPVVLYTCSRLTLLRPTLEPRGRMVPLILVFSDGRRTADVAGTGRLAQIRGLPVFKTEPQQSTPL